jgi:hypothetical protein
LGSADENVVWPDKKLVIAGVQSTWGQKSHTPLSHSGRISIMQTNERRSKMKRNVGTIDRVLRVVVGIALVVVGFGVLEGTAGIVVGVIGLIPLATGLIGWCPLYSLFKLRTSKQA